MRLWNEATTIVATATRESEAAKRWSPSRIVNTPLDLVLALERLDPSEATVILAGDFAQDRAFAAFLEEAYPQITVIVDSERVEAERHDVERAPAFLPAYA